MVAMDIHARKMSGTRKMCSGPIISGDTFSAEQWTLLNPTLWSFLLVLGLQDHQMARIPSATAEQSHWNATGDIQGCMLPSMRPSPGTPRACQESQGCGPSLRNCWLPVWYPELSREVDFSSCELRICSFAIRLLAVPPPPGALRTMLDVHRTRDLHTVEIQLNIIQPWSSDLTAVKRPGVWTSKYISISISLLFFIFLFHGLCARYWV